MIIGLTGLMGSGKTEVVRILEQRGFSSLTLSKMVRAEAEKQGLEQTRANLQDLGNLMRKREGAGVLAKKAIDFIKSSTQENWVIDGIRNPAEIEELRQLPNISIIGLHVDRPTLISRILKRGRESDSKTESEIIKVIERERGVGQPADGQQVDQCVKMADSLVINDGTLEDLASKILSNTLST